MRNKRNYYRILQVQPDAPPEIIRSCYRTLMQTLKHHPDLGGDDWNATLINEAYNTLMNPERRAEYDRNLAKRGGITDFNRNNKDTGQKQNVEKPEKTTQANKPYRSQTTSAKLCHFCDQPWSTDASSDPDAVCADCQSPLYPVVRVREQSGCQRAVQRVELNKPLNIYLKGIKGDPISGVLRNLSPNGLQFTCTGNLWEGQTAKIEAHAFAAVAQIVNIAGRNALGTSALTVGAQFLTLRFHTSRGTFVSAKA